MSDPVSVFVNGRLVRVERSGVALDAVRLADPEVAAAIERGERALTDSRGLPVSPDQPLHGGAIFRVVSGRSAGGALRPSTS